MSMPPSLHVSARTAATVGHGLASYIQRSWERCADLDPALLRDPAPLSLADLNVRRESQHRLLELARPEIAVLESLAEAAHSVVLLADPSGLILQESGNKTFLGKARRVALQPGVSWAESMRGTNAVGTALHDGRAVRVHGAEHFLPSNRILSCHAAPVFSGTGGILGVLDLSGPAEETQGYALGLVQMYASLIGNRILHDTPLRRLVFQADPTRLDGVGQAILLIDDARRIAGANPAALQLLDTDWCLIGSPLEQWIDGGLSQGTSTGALRSRDGKPLVGTLHAPGPRLHPVAVRPTPAGGIDSTPEFDPALCVRLEQAVRAANAGLALLLQGETGTGKEVLARRVHTQSIWRGGRFIAINCGALPESLVESELFGYESGAFTGARREGARGLLRQAHKGVLFLDEIGDMPLGLQTRLLRVLQEREVQPLGSEKSIPLEFGLISASNRDLKAMVDHGTFRADLYYRLQDLQVCLPPLRERDDLAQFLQRSFMLKGGRYTPDALVALGRYAWPGNYREMHSVMRRLLCLYPDQEPIDSHMLPAEIRAARPLPLSAIDARAPAPSMPGTPASPRLCDLEQSAIDAALQACQGNISLAARKLGIHRSTLHRRLKARDHGAPSGR
ncbi:sigma-54-dependent Fis family transcriptional regulator [Paralcaligenes ginsengisoli]